uniref:Uncharacterized protein n=1 Tax=Glossina pallidipes TaxID=7398 RepID=A0A1B0A7D5_GLOPL
MQVQVPEHVVSLYVATYGQNGPGLGSDEKEIILLVYVILEATTGQIILRSLSFVTKAGRLAKRLLIVFSYIGDCSDYLRFTIRMEMDQISSWNLCRKGTGSVTVIATESSDGRENPFGKVSNFRLPHAVFMSTKSLKVSLRFYRY